MQKQEEQKKEPVVEAFPFSYWITHESTRTYQGKLHFHRGYYEMYLFLEGDVRFLVDGVRYQLIHGDLFLICPGTIHMAEINPAVTYNRLILHLSEDLLSSLSTEKSDLTQEIQKHMNRRYRLEKRDIRRAEEAADRLKEELKKDAPYGSDVMARALFSEIIVETLRKTEELAPDSKEYPPLIREAVTYIHSHLAEDFSIDDMAASLHVSRSLLTHDFSVYFGRSLWSYVIFQRLSKASELLLEGSSVSDACSLSGFGSYSYFIKAFTKTFGMTPKKFQMHGKQEETYYL